MSRAWISEQCSRCSGHGRVAAGPNYPDECPDCGGKGTLVVYVESGVIAKYPGGPLRGRTAPRNSRHAPTSGETA